VNKVPGSVLTLSVISFLFVYEIWRGPLNGFVPNLQGRRVWFLARTSLNVKVKGQGLHGQKGIFRPFRRPACSLCLVNIFSSGFKLRAKLTKLT